MAGLRYQESKIENMKVITSNSRNFDNCLKNEAKHINSFKILTTSPGKQK
jgi:hypothetical protein